MHPALQQIVQAKMMQAARRDGYARYNLDGHVVIVDGYGMPMWFAENS